MPQSRVGGGGMEERVSAVFVAAAGFKLESGGLRLGMEVVVGMG